MVESASPPPSRAQVVFAEYLRRVDEGEDVEFEELCREHRDVASELEALREDHALIGRLLPGTLPGFAAATAEAEIASDLLRRLRAAGVRDARYRVKGEIARGGMGIVMSAWDEELRRTVAMKIARGNGPAADARILGRFLEEAQVTSQLEHPGIVPVHEVGLRADGAIYYTMRLVDGVTLEAVLARVRAGADGWNQVRALGILVRVCEAMAYAHSKGVVHRDLKPANVMVGPFGEVYVMDWGLARVLGPADGRDGGRGAVASERGDLRRSSSGSGSPLVTEAGDVLGTPSYMPPEQAGGELAAIGPRSDVYAVGAMLFHILAGRPPYHEDGERPAARVVFDRLRAGDPELLRTAAPRAAPELAAICAKAMARHQAARYGSMAEFAADLRAYLEGRVVAAHRSGAWVEFAKWVRRNKAVAALAAAVVIASVGAGVLFASKRAEARAFRAQLDLLEAPLRLDESLRRARELDPPWPDRIPALRRWLADDAEYFRQRKAETERALGELARSGAPGQEPEERAAEREQLAARLAALSAADAVRRGAALPGASVLPPAIRALPPVDLAMQFAMLRVHPTDPRRRYGEERLALAAARRAAAELAAGAPAADRLYVWTAAGWAAFANGCDEEALQHCARIRGLTTEGIEDAERHAAALEAAVAEERESPGAAARAAEDALRRFDEGGERDALTFDDPKDKFLHTTLTALLGRIEAFERTDVPAVAARLEWAERIGELTVRHPHARVTWDEARSAIARADGVSASSLYAGAPIDLRPQIGLVPIGMNPATKLWEFYELRSAWQRGAGPEAADLPIPELRADGSIAVGGETGIVFVLVPGGTFSMGAQNTSPEGSNYDEQANGPDELPMWSITLEPFFLARHELTKGQWQRLSESTEVGSFAVGQSIEGEPLEIGLAHPVEMVSWDAGSEVLARHGLGLPTEAQWEYAARAGTTTRFWSGSNGADLEGVANILDTRGHAAHPQTPLDEFAFDDGFAALSPVGSFRANAFGMHDVHGNVWEWCEDAPLAYSLTPRADDGFRDGGVSVLRIKRGGSYLHTATFARSARRYQATQTTQTDYIGLRAARRLLP